MMYASGYTLQLECDCEDCFDEETNYAWPWREEEIVALDGKDCRKKCFKIAKMHGWKIEKDGKCYAKGHKRRKKY